MTARDALSAAVEREGALPVSVGPVRLSDEPSARETIRNVLLAWYADSPDPVLVADTLMAKDRADATAELTAVRAELDEARQQLEVRIGHLSFLERNTLPELRRTIEHHQDGKQRWRERAETAETRVAELEAERHSTNEALSDAAEALREAQTERLRTLLAPTDTDPTTPEEGS